LSCTLKVQTNVQLKNQVSTTKKHQFSIGVQQKYKKTPSFCTNFEVTHREVQKTRFFEKNSL